MNGTAYSYFQSTLYKLRGCKIVKRERYLERFYKNSADDAESLKDTHWHHSRNLQPVYALGFCWVWHTNAFHVRDCYMQKLPSSNFMTVRPEQGRAATCSVSATLESQSQACWHALVLRTGSPAKVTSWEAQTGEDRGVTSTGSLRPRPLQSTFISHFISVLIESTCITAYLDKYTSKNDYFIDHNMGNNLVCGHVGSGHARLTVYDCDHRFKCRRSICVSHSQIQLLSCYVWTRNLVRYSLPIWIAAEE